LCDEPTIDSTNGINGIDTNGINGINGINAASSARPTSRHTGEKKWHVR
jgi:hypothetical protein